jgi:lysozyme
MTEVNAAGKGLVKESEGFLPLPYPDPGSALYRAAPRLPWGRRPAAELIAQLPNEQRGLSGAPWTQGYGFTDGITPDSPPMSQVEADARFDREIEHFADGVARLLTLPANENEFAAMVSLAFNIGLAAFARSTVLKAHNRGDTAAAARAFGLWNKAGGRVMAGLSRRRAREAALYLKPVALEIPVQRLNRDRLAVQIDAEPPQLPMPQRIDPERSLSQSGIMRASTVTGGVGALTLAAEGARAVGEIRYSLGEWLPYVALAVVVLGAAWIAWERIQQRRGGWA